MDQIDAFVFVFVVNYIKLSSCSVKFLNVASVPKLIFRKVNVEKLIFQIIWMRFGYILHVLDLKSQFLVIDKLVRSTLNLQIERNLHLLQKAVL